MTCWRGRIFPFSRLDRWPDMGYSRRLVNTPHDTDQDPVGRTSKEDLTALFDAVELRWYSRVCSLVTKPGLNLSGLNEDGMTPLDVALLLSDTPISRVLQHHGAHEGTRYRGDPELRRQHVIRLLQEAEITRTHVLGNPLNESSTGVSGQQEKEVDQKMWKYRKMLTTLRETALPKAPQQLTVSVLSGSSVKVECYEPQEQRGSSLVTQYLVQWSCCPQFKSDVWSETVPAGHFLSHKITGLTKGTTYYFTVQAGNIKGFGSSAPPVKCRPSHWSDGGPHLPDTITHLSVISKCLSDLRTEYAALFPHLLAQTPSKTKTRNKSLSRIFSSPKFVKSLNRCLYLSVLHCTPSGKVLLTESDKLPTVEVESLVTAPSAQSELLWLFKHAVAGWPGTQQLREELAPCQEIGGIGLRYKLLSGALYLQECLGCGDLGLPYYRLVKREGQLLILLVRTIHPASPPFTAVSLKPLTSLSTPTTTPPRDALDIAHLNAADLCGLYGRFSTPPTPGLFVGLLQLRVRGEDLEVVVDRAAPLLPPLEYVRENAHLTAEEWTCLTQGGGGGAAAVLCRQVSAAACTLLSRLREGPSDIDTYSLYTGGLLEVAGAAVLLLVPPAVVAPLGVEAEMEGSLSVPLQNYEILLNVVTSEELTRSLLHLTGHLATCQALLGQQIRGELAQERVTELRRSQAGLKGLQEQLGEVWGEYRPLTTALSLLVGEGSHGAATADSPLRPLSELLSPSSPATSVTDTPDRGSSGVVRIYSSPELTVPSPCIKLHITGSTRSRDLIASVVRKLRRQGHPVAEEGTPLRLVVTVSNVLHQIPDTVPVLQLGEPWVSARFQIRHVISDFSSSSSGGAGGSSGMGADRSLRA